MRVMLNVVALVAGGSCGNKETKLAAVCRGCTQSQCTEAAPWGCSWKGVSPSFLTVSASTTCAAAGLQKSVKDDHPCGDAAESAIQGSQSICDAASDEEVCRALTPSVCQGPNGRETPPPAER
mmetsp:Transcript_79267/g.212005  ORF Transcript_79267/g.212005 Transcript_79267/m.212005 type:complete len:123 (+) Transcript_79267:84-452(+)